MEGEKAAQNPYARQVRAARPYMSVRSRTKLIAKINKKEKKGKDIRKSILQRREEMGVIYVVYRLRDIDVFLRYEGHLVPYIGSYSWRLLQTWCEHHRAQLLAAALSPFYGTKVSRSARDRTGSASKTVRTSVKIIAC